MKRSSEELEIIGWLSLVMCLLLIAMQKAVTSRISFLNILLFVIHYSSVLFFCVKNTAYVNKESFYTILDVDVMLFMFFFIAHNFK